MASLSGRALGRALRRVLHRRPSDGTHRGRLRAGGEPAGRVSSVPGRGVHPRAGAVAHGARAVAGLATLACPGSAASGARAIAADCGGDRIGRFRSPSGRGPGRAAGYGAGRVGEEWYRLPGLNRGPLDPQSSALTN